MAYPDDSHYKLSLQFNVVHSSNLSSELEDKRKQEHQKRLNEQILKKNSETDRIQYNCESLYNEKQSFSDKIKDDCCDKMNEGKFSSNATGQSSKFEDDFATKQSISIDQINRDKNIVVGYYELSNTLGKGNFSTVKLARHSITEHNVAIKIINTSKLSDENLHKIHREIDVMKKLDKYEHIVSLYQIIKTRRYYMLVTEYCQGGELYEFVVKMGRLKEDLAHKYFKQILSAICFLHKRKIVHRDLKTENILMTNNYETVKLADFGFANYFDKNKLLSTWCGSPPYAAPELFKRIDYVGPEIDFWSLGIILYVLVCGSLPFDGLNISQLQARILSGKFRIPFFMSTECEGLIRGLLRIDPIKRYNSTQTLKHRWTNKFIINADEYDTIDKIDVDMQRCHSSGIESMDFQHKCAKNSSKAFNHNKMIKQFVTQSTIATDHADPLEIKRGDYLSIESSRGKSLDLDNESVQNQSVNMRQQDSNWSVNNLKNIFTKFLNERKQIFGSFLNTSTAFASIHMYQKNLKSKLATSNRNMSYEEDSKPSKKESLDRIDQDVVKAVSNLSLGYNATDTKASDFSFNVTGGDSCNSIRDSSSPTLRKGNCLDSLERDRLDNQPKNKLKRQFVKGSSLDEQILDYMVNELNIAPNHFAILNSIRGEKFDDLHAVYRMIKDKPDKMLESIARVRFKVPSLPIIPVSKMKEKQVFSITSGLVQSKQMDIFKADSKLFEMKKMSIEDDEETHTEDNETKVSILSNEDNNIASNRNPFDLSFKAQSQQNYKVINQLFSALPIEVCNKPPQLFLTPPIDMQGIDSNVSGVDFTISSQTDRILHTCIGHNHSNEGQPTCWARHSFDSSIDRRIIANANSEVAKAAPAWDSAVLDIFESQQTDTMLNDLSLTTQNQFDAKNSILSCQQTISNKNNYFDNSFSMYANDAMNLGQDFKTQQQKDNICNQSNKSFLLSINEMQSDSPRDRQQQISVVDYQAENNCFANIPNNQDTFMAQSDTHNNQHHMTTFNGPNNSNLALLHPPKIDDDAMTAIERRASDGQASYNSPAMVVANPGFGHELNYFSGSKTVTIKPRQAHCSHREDRQSLLFRNNVDNNLVSSQSQLSMPINYSNHETPIDLSLGGDRTFSQRNQSNYIPDSVRRNSSHRYYLNSLSPLSSPTTTTSSAASSTSTASPRSPRSRSLVGTTCLSKFYSQHPSGMFIPFRQRTLSSLASGLESGGPGHLKPRRKRYSLDTEHQVFDSNGVSYEQRRQFHKLQRPHIELGSLMNMRQSFNYPPLSHIGQLRKLSQVKHHDLNMKD